MGKQNKNKKLAQRIRELQSVHSVHDDKKLAMIYMKKFGGKVRNDGFGKNDRS